MSSRRLKTRPGCVASRASSALLGPQVDLLSAPPDAVGDRIELGVHGDAEAARRPEARPGQQPRDPPGELVRGDRARQGNVEPLFEGMQAAGDIDRVIEEDEAQSRSPAPLDGRRGEGVGSGRGHAHDRDAGPLAQEDAHETLVAVDRDDLRARVAERVRRSVRRKDQPGRAAGTIVGRITRLKGQHLRRVAAPDERQVATALASR